MEKTALTRISKIAIAIAVCFVICGIAAGTALTEDHGHRYRGDYDWDRGGFSYTPYPDHYYAPQPNYYYAPEPDYYYYPTEPQYYYEPQREYYPPSRPPGISLFFGLD